MLNQEWTLEELQHYLDILVNASHGEPLEAVYYWEKKKYSQISDMKFHKA